jgi:ribosomal protein S18 acetylase RimI-like enzyme
MRTGTELQPGVPHGGLPSPAHSASTKTAGIGQMILAAVEQKAQDTNCCKVTLEVQENNHRAQRVYEAAGFSRSAYVEAAGGALFLSKAIKDH